MSNAPQKFEVANFTKSLPEAVAKVTRDKFGNFTVTCRAGYTEIGGPIDDKAVKAAEGLVWQIS